MFDGKHYTTKGVNENVPKYLQNLLWFMAETMDSPKKDFLQVFELSSAAETNKPMQKIIHSQEQPPYYKEHLISAKKPIKTRVFVIDNGTYSIMLLLDGYYKI